MPQRRPPVQHLLPGTFFLFFWYTIVLRTQPNTLGRGAPAALRPQCPAIDYRIVPGSFSNSVAELECVTLPWRLLQEA